MYNIPNEVQIGTLRVSLLCEHWCSVYDNKHSNKKQLFLLIFCFFLFVFLKQFY